ncbi:hypothetical protein Btru_006870 [Bulinus truncatus]|nr:hypothetical protein Btru_006870 [Bulinus truncatus]
MADGSYYLEINEEICCRVNLSVRNWRGGYRLNPAANGQGGTEIGPNDHFMSPAYRPADDMQVAYGGSSSGDVFLHGANMTWQTLREVTSNYTSDVTAFCDVKGENRTYNMSEVNFSLVSEEDYLDRVLGERYVSTEKLIVLTFLYTFIFLTGVLGNVCTCVVITRNRFLHTATNYYLFSLAISDVITLVLAPLVVAVRVGWLTKFIARQFIVLITVMML